MNVHRIPTKLGTEVCFNEPFMCVPNFSPIGAHVGVLWRILQSARNEETKMKLWLLVSWKWLGDFLQIWYICRLPFLAGTSVANLVPIR